MAISEKLKLGLRIKEELLAGETTRPIAIGGELASTMDEFNYDQVVMFNETIWAGIWAREGLNRKQRSLLMLGILAGLNRREQFGLHVRVALKNGVTVDELREICIQIAGYCGGPTGSECLQVTREILREKGYKFAAKDFG